MIRVKIIGKKSKKADRNVLKTILDTPVMNENLKRKQVYKGRVRNRKKDERIVEMIPAFPQEYSKRQRNRIKKSESELLEG